MPEKHFFMWFTFLKATNMLFPLMMPCSFKTVSSSAVSFAEQCKRTSLNWSIRFLSLLRYHSPTFWLFFRGNGGSTKFSKKGLADKNFAGSDNAKDVIATANRMSPMGELRVSKISLDCPIIFYVCHLRPTRVGTRRQDFELLNNIKMAALDGWKCDIWLRELRCFCCNLDLLFHCQAYEVTLNSWAV